MFSQRSTSEPRYDIDFEIHGGSVLLQNSVKHRKYRLGAAPQPRLNRNFVVNDHIIMRLKYTGVIENIEVMKAHNTKPQFLQLPESTWATQRRSVTRCFEKEIKNSVLLLKHREPR